jgi:hypothetical protein
LQTDKCIQDIKDAAVDSMTKLGIEGLKKACEDVWFIILRSYDHLCSHCSELLSLLHFLK